MILFHDIYIFSGLLLVLSEVIWAILCKHLILLRINIVYWLNRVLLDIIMILIILNLIWSNILLIHKLDIFLFEV